METALDSPVDRPKIGRTKDPQRSAITNGKLLPGIDEDSPPLLGDLTTQGTRAIWRTPPRLSLS
jgi:hypothetical protein